MESVALVWLKEISLLDQIKKSRFLNYQIYENEKKLGHIYIYIYLKVDNDHVSDVTTSIHSFILMGTNVSVVRFEFSWNQ